MTRNLEVEREGREPTGEIDLRALASALRRRLRLLVTVAVGACLLVAVIVNVVTPRYTAQSVVLLENQETFFTRPDRVNVQQVDQPQLLDPEAVASQVQLITSRDIARKAIRELHLEGSDEFDPPIGPLKRVLVLFGLMRDPTRETRDARIVTNFLDRLVVYSPPKTRVIAIDFSSRDPDLAARAANTVARLYLETQSEAKRQTAQDAADALAGQIGDLRARLVKADDAREQYRLKTGLLAGSNNMTITGQQLADINTDLSKARTAQADAQAKAQMIRDLLKRGLAADVPDVINNDTVRRIAEQRVQVEGQLALEGRTLLPEHPRIRALTAQVQEYDRALKGAARQAATTLENEATIAGARVANLESVLAQQKTLAGTADVDEVQLRTLDRAADTLKAQLESSTTKYQEALARASSDATPADARIIQRAVPPQDASFPKKIPFIAFGTVAALVFAVGFVAVGELTGGAPVTDVRETTPREVAEPREVRASRRARAAVVWSDETEADASPRPIASDASLDDDLVFAPPRPARDRSRTLPRFLSGGFVATVVARARAFGRSAMDSRAAAGDGLVEDAAPSPGVGWDVPMAAPIEPSGGDAADGAAILERIVAGHVPGHGLHIVCASVGTEAVGVLVDLARSLAEKGRAILVDLDRLPARLAPLAVPAAENGRGVASLVGLAELLVGDASFAEVIHRDGASRLHFIPTGKQEADFRDFDLILDALTATYDFIVLLAPAYPQSEIARIMAPYADFLVLAPASGRDAAGLAATERELVDAGAREVLVAGGAATPHQDVA